MFRIVNRLISILFIFFGITAFSQSLVLKSIQDFKQKKETLLKQSESITDTIEHLMLRYADELIRDIGYPGKGEIISHPGFCLVYNEEHEQAQWVSHVIFPEIKDGKESRTNKFMEDPKIKTQSAQDGDYFTKTLKPDSSGYKYSGFGFDRGHLAPSADFKWSKTALAASYYYSNMSPQRPELNRGRWAELEGLLRDVVIEKNTLLYVVTGPILIDTLPKIKKSINGLSIPYKYWKVAYNPTLKQAIGFIMPNQKCEHPAEWYAVSVDSIEKITSLNFFSSVDDSIENTMEKNFQISAWQNKRQEGETLPLDEKKLPKNAFNTSSLPQLIQSDLAKVTVCGTVVSAKRSKNGHVFLNLDKKFPNQVFSVNIWQSNLHQFNYEPEVYLIDQEICVTGKIQVRDNVAGMSIEREEHIRLLDENPH